MGKSMRRYFVIIIIIPIIGFMVLQTTSVNQVFQCKKQVWKIFTESWDIGKNVSGSFRDFCYNQQNQTTKNENGAQKNVHIFNTSLAAPGALAHRLHCRKITDFCFKQQNQTTKNENGAQKNVHIFKSNASILLTLEKWIGGTAASLYSWQLD